jgi:hypothetical protein
VHWPELLAFYVVEASLAASERQTDRRMLSWLSLVRVFFAKISPVDKYVFLTPEDANKPNASTNTEFSIGSATEYPEYKSVVKYDLSQHDVWSDCTYDEGDLRTREAICACDKCLEGS